MIYELRIYECYGGKLPNLHKRFSENTMRIFEKHGMKNIGYWTTDVGPSNNELTYLIAFEDANARIEAWKNFRADPEWQKVVDESHRDGLIVKNVRNQTLIPTPYSPLQ
ncbi:MAG: NIPSNAP family protein [Dehalococcoidia bacterium]